MVWVYIWCNSMTKVKDVPGTSAKPLENRLNLGLDYGGISS